MSVHPGAYVAEGAQVCDDVEIGPFCSIGRNVRIGRGTRLRSHVVIDGHTVLGENNDVHPFATLGVAPQDLKYRGEPSRLVIGSGNTLREYVNVSIGTSNGGGVTTIGDRNLVMAYCHIAHDCHVGSDTIMANAATLAGHVEVGDHAIIGAFSGVHQYCRVGCQAFVGGYSVVTKDALPYFTTVGNRARVYGVNTLGLRRQGFEDDVLRRIRQMYRVLFQSRLNTSQAVERLKRDYAGLAEVDVVVRFIESSRRGVVKR